MSETKTAVVLGPDDLNSPGMQNLLARMGISPNADGVVTVAQVVDTFSPAIGVSLGRQPPENLRQLLHYSATLPTYAGYAGPNPWPPASASV